VIVDGTLRRIDLVGMGQGRAGKATRQRSCRGTGDRQSPLVNGMRSIL
jgi:hypothetical protein